MTTSRVWVFTSVLAKCVEVSGIEVCLFQRLRYSIHMYLIVGGFSLYFRTILKQLPIFIRRKKKKKKTRSITRNLVLFLSCTRMRTHRLIQILIFFFFSGVGDSCFAVESHYRRLQNCRYSNTISFLLWLTTRFEEKFIAIE